MEDIVTAKMDYTRLDQASSPVRIRLNSTAVRVKNLGEDGGGDLLSCRKATQSSRKRERARLLQLHRAVSLS